MPPAFAPDAVNEAIEAGIPLVIVVTENIPRRLVAQFLDYARREGVRLIGPNCLGLISPGKTRLGGVGGAAASTRVAFQPGVVGGMRRCGGDFIGF